MFAQSRIQLSSPAVQIPPSIPLRSIRIVFAPPRAAAIAAGRTHYTTAVRCRTFPADGFVLSSNADTFYNARGSYLAHCEFHHMCDDGANSLGYGTPIRSQDGPRSLSIRAIWGRLRVGDVVQVMEAMTGRFWADLRIAKVERYVSADKLPEDLELLPDAWGQPRRRSSSACGALNAPPTGLMLLVR